MPRLLQPSQGDSVWEKTWRFRGWQGRWSTMLSKGLKTGSGGWLIKQHIAGIYYVSHTLKSILPILTYLYLTTNMQERGAISIIPMLQAGQLRQRREDRNREEVQGFAEPEHKPKLGGPRVWLLNASRAHTSTGQEKCLSAYVPTVLWGPEKAGLRTESPRLLGVESWDQRQWRGHGHQQWWKAASGQVALTSAHTARTGADTPGRGQDRAFHQDQMHIHCKALLTFVGKIKCFLPEGAWSLEGKMASWGGNKL